MKRVFFGEPSSFERSFRRLEFSGRPRERCSRGRRHIYIPNRTCLERPIVIAVVEWQDGKTVWLTPAEIERRIEETDKKSGRR